MDKKLQVAEAREMLETITNAFNITIDLQEILDDAVQITTRAALAGRPIRQLVWIPSQAVGIGQAGTFTIEYESNKIREKQIIRNE